jgi:small-conductance mechanosensitive channel
MIQIARPFRIGHRVQIRSGALAGVIEGVVTEFSVTYVRVETADGPMLLPNAQVLAAAVAPLPPAPLDPLEPPAAIVAADSGDSPGESS